MSTRNAESDDDSSGVAKKQRLEGSLTDRKLSALEWVYRILVFFLDMKHAKWPSFGDEIVELRVGEEDDSKYSRSIRICYAQEFPISTRCSMDRGTNHMAE